MPTAHVIVTGRVQGVFYRQSTRQRAATLGLSGWVRNLPDGTVEMEACGPRDQVELLIEWCKDGPPAAVVERTQMKWRDEENDLHQGAFEIR